MKPKFASRLLVAAISLSGQIPTGVAAMCVAVLPVGMAFWYVNSFGVSAVYADQWFLLPDFSSLYTGQLSFAQLFAQHNEHRIFFPRIVMLALGTVTRYNNRAEMFFGWAVAGAACLTLAAGMLESAVWSGSSRLTLAPPALLTSFLILTFRQHENFLWGWQIQVIMTATSVVLASYMLSRSTAVDRHFLWAAACSTVGSFSFANGLLIWPVGLAQLSLWPSTTQQLSPWRGRFNVMAVWGCAGLCESALYIWGYRPPPGSHSLLDFLHRPLQACWYFLAFLGSPLIVRIDPPWLSSIQLVTRLGGALVLEEIIAAALGAVLLVAYLWLLVRSLRIDSVPVRRSPVASASLSLIVATMLSGGLLVVGRVALGPSEALASKYVTLGVLGIAGAIIQFHDGNRVYVVRSQRYLGVLVTGLVLAGTVAAYVHGIAVGEWTQTQRSMIAYFDRTYSLQSDENLSLSFENPGIVRGQAPILEKYHLNVFSDFSTIPSRAASPSLVTGAGIETVLAVHPSEPTDTIVIPPNQQTITITGWAIDRTTDSLAGGVYLEFDNQLDVPTLYGLDDSVVPNVFRESGFQRAGFFASFAAHALTIGRHSLTLKVVNSSRSFYFPVQTGITIVRQS